MNELTQGNEPEDPGFFYVETPESLRPNLAIMGIIEIEKGICEDNSRNRKLLREYECSWLAIYGPNGETTNFIEAVSAGMSTARIHEVKKTLLEDDRDVNSDFLTGLGLLLLTEEDAYVPAWVLAATRMWRQIEKQREENPGKKLKPSLVRAPGRCVALTTNGRRCANWHDGRDTMASMCRLHVGRIYNVQFDNRAKARNRLNYASLEAANTLIELSENAASEPVRAQAAREILDRAGIRGGVEIDTNVTVEVRPARDIILNRLAELRKGLDHTIPKEITVEAEPDGN